MTVRFFCPTTREIQYVFFASYISAAVDTGRIFWPGLHEAEIIPLIMTRFLQSPFHPLGGKRRDDKWDSLCGLIAMRTCSSPTDALETQEHVSDKNFCKLRDLMFFRLSGSMLKVAFRLTKCIVTV